MVSVAIVVVDIDFVRPTCDDRHLKMFNYSPIRYGVVPHIVWVRVFGDLDD